MKLCTWEPPSTVSRPRPVRTAESTLWRTPAGQVTSSKRFTWSQTQTDVFWSFVRYAYPNHKSCDLAPLLCAFDLGGYNSVRNQHDESVYRLIVEKVRRKIGNTELAMGDRRVPLGSHAG